MTPELKEEVRKNVLDKHYRINHEKQLQIDWYRSMAANAEMEADKGKWNTRADQIQKEVDLNDQFITYLEAIPNS